MDKIITRDELIELRNDIEFVDTLVFFLSQTTVCYYCDKKDTYLTTVENCHYCNGPLEDGFVLVGVIGDNEIFVSNERTETH